MALSADDIMRAFRALSDELERRSHHAQIIVVGGAALVLLFQARETTKDVDAYFIRPDATEIRNAVEAVANSLELPNDWLNDAAKGYLIGLTIGPVLYESKNLDVRAATTPQLLAMKLAAWRDAIDRSDARLLLSDMEGSAEQIWARISPFVPPHLADKASYAFEDLWESLYGPS
jgi:hypothetical protein